MENSIRFLKKLKIELSCDSAITFLGIYLRKQKSLIHKDAWADSWAGKESTCNAGNPDLISGLGRPAGEGIGYPLQYSQASLVAHLVSYKTLMNITQN